MVLLQGILGLSWCLQDPGMLLSTGKDSRTILWDADHGHQLGEFQTPSFNFDVQWSPTQAGVFATSSYGGGDGRDGTVRCTPACTAQQQQAVTGAYLRKTRSPGYVGPVNPRARFINLCVAGDVAQPGILHCTAADQQRPC